VSARGRERGLRGRREICILVGFGGSEEVYWRDGRVRWGMRFGGDLAIGRLNSPTQQLRMRGLKISEVSFYSEAYRRRCALPAMSTLTRLIEWAELGSFGGPEGRLLPETVIQHAASYNPPLTTNYAYWGFTSAEDWEWWTTCECSWLLEPATRSLVIPELPKLSAAGWPTCAAMLSEIYGRMAVDEVGFERTCRFQAYPD
jgi:hypothetical protein